MHTHAAALRPEALTVASSSECSRSWPPPLQQKEPSEPPEEELSAKDGEKEPFYSTAVTNAALPQRRGEAGWRRNERVGPSSRSQAEILGFAVLHLCVEVESDRRRQRRAGRGDVGDAYLPERGENKSIDQFPKTIGSRPFLSQSSSQLR